MANGLFSSDDDIITCIKRGDDRWAVSELYRRCYPSIASHIKKNSGKEEDAEDMFQRAIFIFCEKITQNRLTLTASIKTYLFSVCSKLWLKELRRKRKFLTIPLSSDLEIEDIEGSMDDDEKELTGRQRLAYECIEEQPERCKRILQLFYFNRLSMKAVAEKVNLANEDSTKNAKSRCIKNIRDCVQQKMSQA